MPRKFDVPSTVYAVGTYTFDINNLPPNVEKITASFSREGWPGVPADDVARVTILWNDGSGGSFTFPGGTVLKKDGTIATHSMVETEVPIVQGLVGRERKAVQTGTVTFQVFQSLRTAISAEAV